MKWGLRKILVVSSALIFLAAAGIGFVLYRTAYRKDQALEVQLKGIEQALQEYLRRCGSFPTSANGLQGMFDTSMHCHLDRSEFGGEGLSIDPWGDRLIYESDGKSYLIRSKNHALSLKKSV